MVRVFPSVEVDNELEMEGSAHVHRATPIIRIVVNSFFMFK